MTAVVDTNTRPRRTYEKPGRWSADSLFHHLMRACGAITVLLLVAMGVFLLRESWPSLSNYGIFRALHSVRWAPSEAVAGDSSPNPYGILQFIYGTLLTSAIAMLIAVPVSIAVALVITDLAPPVIRQPLTYLVDLLAAIPSVVYGFWGIFALIPVLTPIGSRITSGLGAVPLIGGFFAGPFFGVSYFTAGLVLAIMVLPIVISICREVFATAPRSEKEAALALGATRWEMLRMAVLPRSRSGIAGAAILGLGRAIGETIAVTMVIGNNVLTITKSIFGQGATMSSVIANEFNEATQPYHLESLFVVGFWLFVLSFIVNALGKLIVSRVREDIA
jgi:phosphate transport system permease protein